MLLREVEPIDEFGIDLLKKNNAEMIIDKIVELPLRKACKMFIKKGVRTVMSSANKNNILPEGKHPTEKEDVYEKGQQFFWPRPTYEDAGKGYAWVMLDFDSLSDTNKDLLFSLQQKVTENGEKAGEKAIWFVQDDDYNFSNILFEEKENSEETQSDERLMEFKNRHIVLGYNTGRYPMRTVFLRMPVNNATTVEEVEDFFLNFARSFEEQTIKKEVKER